MATVAAGHMPAAVAVRWVGLSLLLATEAVGVSLWWDAAPLAEQPGVLGTALGHMGDLLKVALALVGVLLLIVGPRLPVRIQALAHASRGHNWVPRLAAHLLLLVGFLVSSSWVFDEGNHNIPLSAAGAATWFALGFATFAAWLLAFAPWYGWRGLLSQERRALLVSAVVAIGAWLAGQAAQLLWRPLADATFWLSRAQLHVLYPDVVADPGERILGTSSFQAEISPQCSGYEGIGLIIAFCGVYLWLFRRHLRFPHALLLLPISAGIIWLFNALRITTLIAIGDSWSPDVAVAGFHSQAGWISFIVVALLIVGATHRLRVFATSQDAMPAEASQHALLAAALLVPFVVLMATAIVTKAFSAGFDAWYPLKVVITAGTLWYLRAAYRQLAWSWSWHSVAIGVAVFVVWLLLEPVPESPATLPNDLATLPIWIAGLWLIFRVLGSVIVVPLVEELAFRGYLLRKLAASNFEAVDPRRFAPFAFVASSILFGILHGRWLAGTLAGMAYALAVYRRGRIGDAVVAHSATNALIAADVLLFGQWELWT